MEERIVVSLIGEMWSPQTLPERIAQILIKTKLSDPEALASGTTKGIRIVNVPQLVPVEKAKNKPNIKNTAGINPKLIPLFVTIRFTKEFIASSWQTQFNVHARTRISIAPVIDLKPAVIQSVNSEYDKTFLGKYKIAQETIDAKAPIHKLTPLLQLPNASIIDVEPLNNPPV